MAPATAEELSARMNKREFQYRGYTIRCRLIGKWFAQIFPPGASRALREIPVATREEGYEHLAQLAQAIVDKKLGPKE